MIRVLGCRQVSDARAVAAWWPGGSRFPSRKCVESINNAGSLQIQRIHCCDCSVGQVIRSIRQDLGSRLNRTKPSEKLTRMDGNN